MTKVMWLLDEVICLCCQLDRRSLLPFFFLKFTDFREREKGRWVEGATERDRQIDRHRFVVPLIYSFKLLL